MYFVCWWKWFSEENGCFKREVRIAGKYSGQEGLVWRTLHVLEGRQSILGTFANRYGGSMWKFSSRCFCHVLFYFMNQEAVSEKMWQEKSGGMGESPDRVGEWVKGRAPGELSGSTEDEVSSHDLVFFPSQFSWWMHLLRLNVVGGLLRDYRYIIPFL